MITDIRLLGELNELKDSRFYEHLLKLKEDASEEIDNAATDRVANVAIGKRRILKELLEEIDNALGNFQTLKAKEATSKAVNMSKTF